MQKNENDISMVSAQYGNSHRLSIMRDFHTRITRSGPTPFQHSYGVMSSGTNLHVIDVGCGVGGFWNDFNNFQFVSSVELLDKRIDLINEAQSVIHSKGIQNISIRQIDLNDEIYKAHQRADYILAHQVYHHLLKPERLHINLINQLASHGALLVTTCNVEHMYEIYIEISNYFGIAYEEIRGLSHFNGGHLQEMPNLTRVTNLNGYIYCDSAALLCDYVNSLAIWHRVHGISGSDIYDFHEYLKAWASEHIQRRGSVRLTQSVSHSVFRNC